MSTDPIVILGAGPAGVSAAWRLAEERFNWERESEPLIRRVAELVGPPR